MICNRNLGFDEGGARAECGNTCRNCIDLAYPLPIELQVVIAVLSCVWDLVIEQIGIIE